MSYHVYTTTDNLLVDSTNTVDITAHDGATKGLKVGGTLITATAAEVNAACDTSKRLVNLTAASLTMSEAVHGGGRTLTVNVASGTAITLPAATGSGTKFRLVLGTLITSNTTTVTTGAGDYLGGLVLAARQSSGLVTAYMLNGSSNHILTLNGSTQGGTVGDLIELEDVASHLWECQVRMQTVGASSSPVT